MTQDRRYRLIFNGQISFEYDTFEVKKNICMLFNSTPETVDTYFTGITVVLRENLARDEADRMKKVFDGTGGVAIIEEMGCVPIAATPPTQPEKVASGTCVCPKCGARQAPGSTCVNCGIIFNKVQQHGKQETVEQLQSDAGDNRQPQREMPPLEENIDQREMEARKWAMICHLSALSGFIIPFGLIPFGNILGPLVIWLVRKDQFEFVREHGKIALNFQIPVTILILLSWLARLFIHEDLILLPAVLLTLYSAIMMVLASLKAQKGELIRIPLSRALIS